MTNLTASYRTVRPNVYGPVVRRADGTKILLPVGVGYSSPEAARGYASIWIQQQASSVVDISDPSPEWDGAGETFWDPVDKCWTY